MAFDEVQFPTSISLDAESTPRRKVDVVRFGSGYELRSEKWKNSLRAYDISLGIRDIEDVRAVIDFWEARGGRARGFRFKDWADWEAKDEVLAPDGSPTVQLFKNYQSGSQSFSREIKKPVAGSVSLKKNGSSYSFDSLDDTTGILTLNPEATKSITDVTASSPAKVTTSSSHNLSDGEKIWIINTNLSEIDNQVWNVSVIDSTTISLDGSDTSGTGGSSVGTVEKYIQPTESLSWSGEFDVPVRFEQNTLPISVKLVDLGSLPEISLVEIRL